MRMFKDWLGKALDGVELCVFEAPILYKAKASLPVLRKLYGCAAMVELLCNEQGIKCFEVNNQLVKTFMGCRRGRGIDPKKAMVEAVQRWGCAPQTHDEADAIAIRYYVIHQMFPEARKEFTLELGALGAAAAY